MKTSRSLILLSTLLPLAGVWAQPTASTGAITGISFVDSSLGAPVTVNVGIADPNSLSGAAIKTVTYENNSRTLTEFTVGSNTYTPLSILPSSVVLRRTTTPIAETFPNNVWNQAVSGASNSNTFVLEGPRVDSSEQAFANNNMFVGMDNIFQNNTTATPNRTSVQRLDVIFEGGITVNEFMSFAIFERGGNDPFQIAAITGLDTNGDPNAYGNRVGFPTGNTTWGSGVGVSINSLVLRSTMGVDENDDPIMISEPHAPSAWVPSQNIHGVNISVVDTLGIASGVLIYGYSLFAGDVTGSGNDLVNWNNASFFPTNTNPANGGLDLMAYHGVYVIPEPGTLLLAGILLGTAFIGLKRR